MLLQNKTTTDVKVFPTQSKGKLFISMANNTDDDFVWITYTDIVGKSRYKELINIRDGVNTYEASRFINLNSGIYFIQITRENQEVIINQKIIKE